VKTRNTITITLILGILILGMVISCSLLNSSIFKLESGFVSARALQDIEYQVGLGARTPGSHAHAQVGDWIITELSESGWEVEIQETESMGHPIRNIIATWGDSHPWILLGAHYDSRLEANRDPDPKKSKQPVPGANDGASGVATLLELSRIIPQRKEEIFWDGQKGVNQVSLVFFDAEDNGKINDWDWILGSRAYVSELKEYPDAVVIIDMIGDKSLNINKEKSSDPNLSEEIWDCASSLGYSNYFIDRSKYSILDDHTPFLEVGVPSVDIIDFDYAHYHTTNDTIDKISEKSLKIVGETLLCWLGRTHIATPDH